MGRMPVLRLLRRISHPCELELGTTQLLKHELVARELHQVNCRCERRLDLNSVLITELISSPNFSNEHGAVTQKFPNCLIFSSRHPPFTDDARIPAPVHNKEQNCRSRCQEQTRALRKTKSHQPEVIIAHDCQVEPKRNYLGVAYAHGCVNTHV